MYFRLFWLGQAFECLQVKQEVYVWVLRVGISGRKEETFVDVGNSDQIYIRGISKNVYTL
jgi:hypothetical protein